MKKIFYFLTLLTLLTFNLFAQPVTQEWVRNYSGPSNDLIGPFLAVDKHGNSYIAGTHVINDSLKILCVKYTTTGVQQWATLYKYPGEGYYAPSGLAIDTSGNAYVSSIYGQNAFSTFNSLLVKFNSLNGSVTWAKRYIGQYGWSEPLDIKIDRINNIYVTGWSDTSHLLIKYNTNGDSIWVRKFHLPGVLDLAYACTIDDSLNVILTGRRRYCSGICFDTVFTAKYSSTGILRWIRTYHYDNLLNYGKKIVADQFGNVYIGGQSRISGYLVYLTLKYDRNGNLQWTKIYDGSGWDDVLTGIVIDRMNNAVFVTGSSQFNGGTSYYATIKYNVTNGDSIWVSRYGMVNYTSSAGDIKIDSLGNSYVTGGSGPFTGTKDIVTIKYSPEGNQNWLISYNGPYNGGDAGFYLGLDNLNNVYVLGLSQSSAQVFDYILIKYSQFSGVQPVSNEIPGVFELGQNYPNPFNPSTKIKFSIPPSKGAGGMTMQLVVYDVLGKEITKLVNERLSPGTYEIEWNADNFSSGVYFYRLVADNKTIETRKMVLVK